MLVRLLYASRAVEPVTPELLGAILRQSRTHNAAHGITGVLCCCSKGTYLQVLEGGRAQVNALYRRIVGDARHGDVELLAYHQIGERRFNGWAMGQVNVAKLNPGVLLKYSAQATLEPHQLSGQAALSLLEELAATASIVGPA